MKVIDAAPGSQGCCGPLRDGASPYRSRIDAKAKYGTYLEALRSPTGIHESASRKARIPGPRFLMDMFQEARLERTSNVLEVGATIGRAAILSRRFSPGGRTVFVQLDPTLTEMSRDEIARWGARVELLPGTPDRFPLPRNEFDAALVDRSFGFVVKKDAMLKEAGRVLKPGGRLVMVDFVRTRAFREGLELGRIGDRYACSLGSVTERELRRLLVDAGFSETRLIRSKTPPENIPPIPKGRNFEERSVLDAIRDAGVRSAVIVALKPQGGVLVKFPASCSR